MPSIEVKCTYCLRHGIDKTIERSPNQVKKNKTQEFFCSIQEMNQYRLEVGGLTKGKHISHGPRIAQIKKKVDV